MKLKGSEFFPRLARTPPFMLEVYHSTIDIINDIDILIRHYQFDMMPQSGRIDRLSCMTSRMK
jgi:hypothetical protein